MEDWQIVLVIIGFVIQLLLFFGGLHKVWSSFEVRFTKLESENLNNVRALSKLEGRFEKDSERVHKRIKEKEEKAEQERKEMRTEIFQQIKEINESLKAIDRK